MAESASNITRQQQARINAYAWKVAPKQRAFNYSHTNYVTMNLNTNLRMTRLAGKLTPAASVEVHVRRQRTPVPYASSINRRSSVVNPLKGMDKFQHDDCVHDCFCIVHRATVCLCA